MSTVPCTREVKSRSTFPTASPVCPWLTDDESGFRRRSPWFASRYCGSWLVLPLLPVGFAIPSQLEAELPKTLLLTMVMLESFTDTPKSLLVTMLLAKTASYTPEKYMETPVPVVDWWLSWKVLLMIL